MTMKSFVHPEIGMGCHSADFAAYRELTKYFTPIDLLDPL